MIEINGFLNARVIAAPSAGRALSPSLSLSLAPPTPTNCCATRRQIYGNLRRCIYQSVCVLGGRGWGNMLKRLLKRFRFNFILMLLCKSIELQCAPLHPAVPPPHIGHYNSSLPFNFSSCFPLPFHSAYPAFYPVLHTPLSTRQALFK